MHSQANLDWMSAEILHTILSDNLIFPADIKSLRLTSRRLGAFCAPYIFGRVRISALIRDKDTFLQVARTPHLAKHVHTLVWGELTGDVDLFEPEHIVLAFSTTNKISSYFPSEVEQGFLSDLVAQIKALFWLTQEHVLNEYGEKQSGSDMPFWAGFLEAVSAFPNLHTLISAPMHPDRQIQPAADNSYPLTVKVVEKCLHCDPGYGFNIQTETVFNAGFLCYFIPLLKLLGDQSDKRVQSLCFSDEVVIRPTSLAHLTPADSRAFSNISNLELRVADKTMKESVVGLGICLAKAVNLSSLHLSYETMQDSPLNSVSPPEDARCPSPFLKMPTLQSLRSLSLESVPLGDIGGTSLDDLEQPAFVEFVKRNAESLREIHVTASVVTRRTISQLSEDAKVKLTRFVITPPDYDSETFSIDEQLLLDVINLNTVDSNTTLSTNSSLALPTFSEPLSTRGTRSITQAWSVGTRYYTAGKWVPVDKYSQPLWHSDDIENCSEYRRSFQQANNLWVGSDGTFYDPRTDTAIISPGQAFFTSDSSEWRITNNRQWDDELGLWRDNSTDQNWRLYKFAFDRLCQDDVEDDELRRYGKWDHNPANLTNEITTLPPQIYLDEDFEYTCRLNSAPIWQFGRGDNDSILYWQVLQLDVEEGFPTEVWHFTHRNGEEAYGLDPLEFWADWEGYAYGDGANPSPFGWRLWLFSLAPIGSQQEKSAWPIPRNDEIGREFSQPTRYEATKDPLNRWDTRNTLPVPGDYTLQDIMLCQQDLANSKGRQFTFE